MMVGLYAHKGRKEDEGIFLSPSPQPLFVWFVELVGCLVGWLDGWMRMCIAWWGVGYNMIRYDMPFSYLEWFNLPG